MRTNYDIKEGRLIELGTESGPIALFIAPTEEDRTLLSRVWDRRAHARLGARPRGDLRVEYDSLIERTTIIWKRPDRRADTDAARFELSSVGIFLDPGRLPSSLRRAQPIDAFRGDRGILAGGVGAPADAGDTIDDYLAR